MLEGEKFELEVIRKIDIRRKKLNLEADEFMTFFEGLTSNMDISFFIKFPDVEQIEISDDECKAFKGYKKTVFRDIVTILKSLHNSDKRSVSQAVAIYTTHLLNGYTLVFLCKMFGPNLEWHDVRNWCNEVEDAFMRDVVPKQLGSQAYRGKHSLKNTQVPWPKHY